MADILAWLEATRLASSIRDSLYFFPFLESIHVIGLTLVFGTISIVDLRLLGLASTRRPFSRVAQDTLRWTWFAFALTVVTGALMFITNAGVYYHSLPFRLKMAMLVVSGLNLAIFDRTTMPSVAGWDTDKSAPPAGKIAAAVSLVLWLAIIFAGRWIGFTTSRAKFQPEPEINIDNLFLPSTKEIKPKDSR